MVGPCLPCSALAAGLPSSFQSEPALLCCLCEVDDLLSLLLQPAIDRANLHALMTLGSVLLTVTDGGGGGGSKGHPPAPMSPHIRPVMGSALTCYHPLGSLICAPSTRASLTVLPGQGVGLLFSCQGQGQPSTAPGDPRNPSRLHQPGSPGLYW